MGGLLSGLGASGRACACVLSAIGTRVGGAQIVSMTHVTHANVYILNTHASYIIFTHLGCPKDALARSKVSREMRDVGPAR